MQYPESTSVAVEQAWSKPGSLKPRGGHHLEPQGFKGLFVSGTTGHFIIHRCGAPSPRFLGGAPSPRFLGGAPSPRQSVSRLQGPQSAVGPSYG